MLNDYCTNTCFWCYLTKLTTTVLYPDSSHSRCNIHCPWWQWGVWQKRQGDVKLFHSFRNIVHIYRYCKSLPPSCIIECLVQNLKLLESVSSHPITHTVESSSIRLMTENLWKVICPRNRSLPTNTGKVWSYAREKTARKKQYQGTLGLLPEF